MLFVTSVKRLMMVLDNNTEAGSMSGPHGPYGVGQAMSYSAKYNGKQWR